MLKKIKQLIYAFLALVFGFKYKRASHSLHSINGWRFILGIFIVVCLVIGSNLVGFVIEKIRATGGSTEEINLYAGNCYSPERATAYNQGWWNLDKAESAPDLGPNADWLEFSDENSSFYAGGQGSMICGQFHFLEEDIAPPEATIEQTDNENTVDSEAAADILPISAEDIDAADTISENGNDASETVPVLDGSQPEPAVSATGSETEEIGDPQTNPAEDGGDITIIDPANQEQQSEGVKVEELNDTNNTEVQIEENDAPENNEPNTQTEPVSFWSSLFGRLSFPWARAQEIIDDKIETMDDLGNFKSATINISLAIGSKPANNDAGAEESAEPLQSAQGPDESGIVDPAEPIITDEEETDNNEQITDNPVKLLLDNGAGSQQIIETGGTDNSEILESSESNENNIIINDQDSPGTANDVNSEEESDIDTIDAAGNVKIIEPETTEPDVSIEAAGEAPAENSQTDQSPTESDILPTSFNNLFKINNALAQELPQGDAKIVVWYTLEAPAGGQGTSTGEAGTTSGAADLYLWHQLDVITADNFSNFENNGYLSFDSPFLQSWEDIKNLQVKLEGVVADQSVFIAYVDSLWVRAQFERESDLDKLKKRQRWENALELLSQNTVFTVDQGGELKFRYNKNEERIWDTLSEMIGIGKFWQDVHISVTLVDSRGQEIDLPVTMVFDNDGEFTINLSGDQRALAPGRYTVRFHIEDESGDEPEIFDLEQDFSWGILAMNFNKSEYTVGEKAYVQLAVLDNLGHPRCDSDLKLEISNLKSGATEILSTENGSIISSKECGPETVTDTPDYYAYYDFGNTGEYTFELTSVTAEGEKKISESIKTVDEKNYDIERIGPTRIYPKSDYGMKLVISAVDDFNGNITEQVPSGFKITNFELRITNSNDRDPFGPNYRYSEETNNEVKNLNWQDVELKAGDELEITYVFDAPDISPEIYLSGPLSIYECQMTSDECGNKDLVFTETRKWQIASDAVRKRARTVMFMAGTYNGGASAGVNTNADTTFSAFKFKLAETGVTIKDAFIMFESQYEAYTAVSDTNYTGYKLGFDACETGTCSLSPFSGTGKVLEDNSNVLSYDDAGGSDGESEDVRLLLDVSAESQLAAYTGNGVEYEGQVGYHFKNSATKTSIASAKAVLILTYTYDIDSPNVTNTVVYPLDSTDGSDRGSRVSSTGSCSRDSGSGGTCPIFDYEMEIPEFPAYSSANRLSQWFTMYDMNDGNNGTDLDPNINIQTFNVDSPSFHFESALGGTQCTVPAMYFPNWASSGYTENSAQQLEYYINSGTNWSVGGEVYETYIASSSAAGKTRTVSFPYGVINNGAVTTLTSANVNVYFPENGEATGTVKIKSAWVRIIPNHFDNGTKNTTVSTKVGGNATSSDLVYGYNAGTTAVKNSYNIINIIPQSDYTALEEANAGNPVTVRVNTTYDDADFGGISAELMITYTYTDESNGYLTSIGLYGGQLTAAPTTSVNLSTAHSVLPEESGKTMLAGALLASYLSSDTSGDVGAGSVYLMDANLSASTPTCTNSFEVEPDDVNSYKELYKNITSALNTTDDQSYTACYSHDTVLSATDAAKMNGILYYTYGWTNSPPTGVFITASTTQKTDGSGTVDIGVEIDDPDDQVTRAMLEFATGTACVFSPSGDPELDETDSNITADYGDPYVENDNTYQIGTADGYIKTASGSNSVFFDWLAAGDLGAVEGDYCLRLTANDLHLDQTIPATTTVYIDMIEPTAPGALSLSSRTGTTITLSFGATSTETNFREYVVYYKPFDGTDPDESDSFLASGTDANLLDISFNDAAATAAITGLTASTTYSFAIWAYDIYGNRASSSRVDITTNDPPSGEFRFYPSTSQKTDGSGVVQISVDIDDDNNQDTVKAKVEYVAGAACDFTFPLDPTLDPSSISASFGLPEINNLAEYQIGQPGNWIITSPGKNTIGFDWLGKTDEGAADGYYCLRLTVNDRFDDQLIPTTTVIKLDNVNPSSTGNLAVGNVTTGSIRLIYATNTPAADTNEPSANAYKIFYKKGTSGVTVNSPYEVDNADLNAYDYGGATSTKVSGLDSNTWYVFNIWSYDAFGNRATATEVAVKTNATLANESLAFTNAMSQGPDTNIALGDSATEWNFRAVVSETNGWYAIGSTTLRLADLSDDTPTYSDLAFRWNQTTRSFSEVGSDVLGAVALSAYSTSTCADVSCTLDFKLLFNNNFASSSVKYNATLMSDNDFGTIDIDNYSALYQVRYPYVVQTHYRWRNDNGGE